MFLDLITLYLLAVGTLLASAGMTFWEYRTHPRRSRELRSLAAGFAVLAVGCAAVLYRRELPGAWGSAFSNLIMLSGYLLILDGAAALNGRRHRALSAAVLASMALIWAALGSRWLDAVWNYVSAAPIALVSALTMIELARCQALKPLQGRFIVVVAAAASMPCFTQPERSFYPGSRRTSARRSCLRRASSPCTRACCIRSSCRWPCSS